MKADWYEPSTSGWHVVHHRRRQERRRAVRLAVGGVTLLLAGALASVVVSVGMGSAGSLVK